MLNGKSIVITVRTLSLDWVLIKIIFEKWLLVKRLTIFSREEQK
jgi:hypothetical protein